MKKYVFLVLFACVVSCTNTATDKVTDEEMIFNMMLETLKDDGVSNVFGHFYYGVDLRVLKRAFEFADPTLTTDEIDSLCATYDYKCSTSIHDLLNENFEDLIVYQTPQENYCVLGYPIVISDNKAVIISELLKHIEDYSYKQNYLAIVFEKKDGVWEIFEMGVIEMED
ncbi:hypothetical protein [Geofilum rhodophaeum]|uniref:hypothetical protein n=1 Tax=Geofilum rhodophaeum TaxID=1965019 RepID=UPI000B526931|nr:hypothetical protein [Geofilum rhodophaeum]